MRDIDDERAALAAERAAIAKERAALESERSSLSQRRVNKQEEGPRTLQVLPGLTKTITRLGVGPCPTKNQLVHIEYEVKLAKTGELVNIIGERMKKSTANTFAFHQAFNLGEEPLRCPSCFDRTVATMQAGEICTVQSLPYYFYGEKGMNDVPGDAHVELTIHLSSFSDDNREPLRNSTLILAFLAFLSVVFILSGFQMPSSSLFAPNVLSDDEGRWPVEGVRL